MVWGMLELHGSEGGSRSNSPRGAKPSALLVPSWPDGSPMKGEPRGMPLPFTPLHVLLQRAREAEAKRREEGDVMINSTT